VRRHYRWIGLVLLALLLVAVALAPLHLDEASMEEALQHAGPFAPLVGVGFMLLQTLLSPIPFALIVMGLGAFFGPLEGTLIAWVGAVLGALLAYALARMGLSGWVPPAPEGLLRNQGFWALLLLRLLPGVSLDIVSYACGAARIPLKPFLLSTALGTIPRISAFSIYGRSLWEHPEWALLATVCLLLLVVLGSRLLRRS